MSRTLLIAVLIPFSVLSGIALWQHGYLGILLPHFQSTGAAQVFSDLVISLSLVLVWMARDAKSTGRRFAPWLIATLVFGSFGPLLYLLSRRAEPTRT